MHISSFYFGNLHKDGMLHTTKPAHYTFCPLVWLWDKGLQTKLHLRLSGQGTKHHARVRIGTTFQKKFGREGTFVGTLVGYDAIEDLYRIQYEDEDVEELSWTDLNGLLRTSGDSITAPDASPTLYIMNGIYAHVRLRSRSSAVSTRMKCAW